MHKERDLMNRQLYVLPCFMKPGKQALIVQSKVYEADLSVKAEEAAK